MLSVSAGTKPRCKIMFAQRRKDAKEDELPELEDRILTWRLGGLAGENAWIRCNDLANYN